MLSYTGGRALTELRERLGARRVAPLYGSVDPDAYRPDRAVARYRADLSYLGTYAADRQAALEEFLVEPARAAARATLRDRRRAVSGGLPLDRQHLLRAPSAARPSIPAFYSSSRLTLNITRAAMAAWATARRAGCSRRPPAARRS